MVWSLELQWLHWGLFSHLTVTLRMHVLSAIDRPLSIPFLLLRKYKWVSHLLLHVLAPHKSLSSITRGNLRAHKSLLKMYPLIYALLFSSLLFCLSLSLFPTFSLRVGRWVTSGLWPFLRHEKSLNEAKIQLMWWRNSWPTLCQAPRHLHLNLRHQKLAQAMFPSFLHQNIPSEIFI